MSTQSAVVPARKTIQMVIYFTLRAVVHLFINYISGVKDGKIVVFCMYVFVYF